MRRILIISVGVVAMMVVWLAPATAGAAAPNPAAAAAPSVVLSDPVNGGLITGGQPKFSGTVSFGSSSAGEVTINIYSGTSAGGVPAQVLAGSVNSGAIGASASGLPDGTYTARAVATTTSGATGSSQPITFELFNGQPQLTLTPPGASIETPAPTFTGTALTGAGDSGTAKVLIYAGTSTNAAPAAVLSGPISASGAFSIQVTPGLTAGAYTAVASQQLASGSTFSPSVAFDITSTAASLTATGAITISAAGKLTAELSCLAGAGTCEGDVLIVTKNTFQPQYGGPRGPLALMFERYSVAAATRAESLMRTPWCTSYRSRKPRKIEIVSSTFG